VNPRLNDLNFNTFLVEANLQPYVQSYWQVQKKLTSMSNFNIAPDGAMGIIINLGDQITIKTQKKNYILKNKGIILLGVFTYCVNMALTNNCHLVGIRFNPAGASAFFRDSSARLYQNNILLDEVELYEKLSLQSVDIADVFNEYLHNKMNIDNHILNLLSLLKYIDNKKGLVDIYHLASVLSMSRRNFDRTFKKYVGLSPKIYIRIIKIKYTRNQLRTFMFTNLTEVGYDNGYFDQAHFIREFKTFMSQVPKDYVKEKKALS